MNSFLPTECFVLFRFFQKPHTVELFPFITERRRMLILMRASITDGKRRKKKYGFEF